MLNELKAKRELVFYSTRMRAKETESEVQKRASLQED